MQPTLTCPGGGGSGGGGGKVYVNSEWKGPQCGRGRERSYEKKAWWMERGRSETEGRRIARGQDGKREQKTRENYGLPRSRPRRHGAHCLAGYLRGNRDPSLSLFPHPSDSPFDHLSHWDTKVERTYSPLSPLRFRACSETTVPPPRHFIGGV
ncbi:hypothetical protein ALC56_03073 [Trachymyrmex septentrionalis]|uniref:Uncharacterized protein n=1 Tax=Trachymyrmex septentrionalis TaxID=34720 RepID=A0A195FQG0_9HYME|nr:hypothetical protein ALC56_03073 [Trachymyrmex septentrionalis]